MYVIYYARRVLSCDPRIGFRSVWLPDQSQEQNEKIYADYRRELLLRQLSNSEKYDSAILTLSMAALGVSMTFLADIAIPISIYSLYVLVISWALFVVSIICVVVSFQTSNKGITKQIDYAENYYLKNDDSYANARSLWASITTGANYIAGMCFILGISFNIFFVTTTLYQQNKEIIMSKKPTKIITNGAEIPIMQMKPSFTGGQEIPTMQMKPSFTRGQEVPSMQPAKPPSDNGNKPANNGGGTSGE